MDVVECIKQRRSVRKYSDRKLDDDEVNTLIEVAICAPSSKNGQPWKFGIFNNPEDIAILAKHCRYSRWMRKATCCIIVFLDRSCSYDYVKDMQSCGAVIQNILLASHSMGISSCWVGELRENGNRIKDQLGIQNDSLEVAGVVTLGYSVSNAEEMTRNRFETFIVRRD